jgi:hypothetical protein
MKISPYTSYLELQPNALLVRQIFYYLQKVGVTQPCPNHSIDPHHSQITSRRMGDHRSQRHKLNSTS